MTYQDLTQLLDTLRKYLHCAEAELGTDIELAMDKDTIEIFSEAFGRYHPEPTTPYFHGYPVVHGHHPNGFTFQPQNDNSKPWIL